MNIMKTKFKKAYMDVAKRFSELSYAKRLKVGCIIVKDNKIISLGYNGTPAGWDNNCETKAWMADEMPSWAELTEQEIEKTWPFIEYSDYDPNAIIGRYRLKSKPEVMHAERNALDKLAKSHESGENATMFITHSPCIECAKSIYGAGIKTVYYGTTYRSTDGIDFLKKCSINVENVN